MRRNFKTLTKEELIRLGIYVLPDTGDVFIGGYQAKYKYVKVPSKHFDIVKKHIIIYDPEFYQLQKENGIAHASGKREIPVGRIVIAWCYGLCPCYRVVDHINNNFSDDRIDNLRLISKSEELKKRRRGY